MHIVYSPEGSMWNQTTSATSPLTGKKVKSCPEKAKVLKSVKFNGKSYFAHRYLNLEWVEFLASWWGAKKLSSYFFASNDQSLEVEVRRY